jgi:hypothetical protein
MATLDMELVARELSERVVKQLPTLLLSLAHGGLDLSNEAIQLECSLTAPQLRDGRAPTLLKVATVDIGGRLTCSPPSGAPTDMDGARDSPETSYRQLNNAEDEDHGPQVTNGSSTALAPYEDNERPRKRRKAIGGLRISSRRTSEDDINAVTRRLESDVRVFPQRRKTIPENPVLAPNSLDKFVSGVWESIYSGIRMDPTEVIEQWQAISGGQPRLLMDAEHELSLREASSAVQGIFGRINVLTRKISQTSRTCRSLEVIVQAYWVQCFEDRVVELGQSMAREKAKKTAINEACADLDWSEKELRNKMGIWRGYHDIQRTAGWAALVFAGMGLYRFCKVCFPGSFGG